MLDGIESRIQRAIGTVQLPSYSWVKPAPAATRPPRIGHGARPSVPCCRDSLGENSPTRSVWFRGTLLQRFDHRRARSVLRPFRHGRRRCRSRPGGRHLLRTLTKEDGSFATMVDIQGWKTSTAIWTLRWRTHKGITAISGGITSGRTDDADHPRGVEKTRKARLYIWMRSCSRLSRAARELSKYAPKMMSRSPSGKNREVIGSGGKVIQKICA